MGGLRGIGYIFYDLWRKNGVGCKGEVNGRVKPQEPNLPHNGGSWTLPETRKIFHPE